VAWEHECKLFARRSSPRPKNEASIISKSAIEPECKTKRVPLDPMAPDKTVLISQDISLEKEIELLSFLDKNSYVFMEDLRRHGSEL
jgi:hypothetical protein